MGLNPEFPIGTEINALEARSFRQLHVLYVHGVWTNAVTAIAVIRAGFFDEEACCRVCATNFTGRHL